MAIIDSQSVKTCYAGEDIGYDAGKKIKGRKRHIITDTQGNIIALQVHSASLQDRVGARLVIDEIDKTKYQRLEVILADGAYSGEIQRYCFYKTKALMRITKRTSEKQFSVIPKRWIVERTFAWLNNYRRLAKDYEKTADSARTWILIAEIRRLTKTIIRLQGKTQQTLNC